MYSIDGSTITNVISALLVSLIAKHCAMLYISKLIPLCSSSVITHLLIQSRKGCSLVDIVEARAIRDI